MVAVAHLSITLNNTDSLDSREAPVTIAVTAVQ